MNSALHVATNNSPRISQRTKALHDLGQRLWLDDINRELLTSGTMARFVDELSVTGLTSNPTLFDRAIAGSTQYDQGIVALRGERLTSEALFYELALQDLRAAADLLRPIFNVSNGLDGWVSLEVSPLLANDAAGTLHEVRRVHALAARPNLFIKIPGSPQGLRAVEDAVAEGIPVNVTLLFSAAHWAAANEAYLRAIERRVMAGKDADVACVASLFISRWDQAANAQLPPTMHNKLGIAMAQLAYCGHHQVLSTSRWQRLAAFGARPQRLLWASTGAKSDAVGECFYVDALVAPNTINTMPRTTLLAYGDHGGPPSAMPIGGSDGAAVVRECARLGIDNTALANKLQIEGVDSFKASWQHLIASLEQKR